VDPLEDFFITKLELIGLLDIMHAKISPTSRNMRMNEAVWLKGSITFTF
jgi:hypothetical protein